MSRTVWWRAAAAALVVATATAIGGVASAGTQTTRHGYDQAQLQRDLDAIRDAGVSGVLAEIHAGNRVLRDTSGTADLATGAPVPVDGHFRMGSNTKTFVSVVVLQLVVEGRVALDDTVDRWLPGVLTGGGHDGRLVTIRQLLNHTSGVFDFDEDIQALVPTAEAFQQHRFDVFEPADLLAMAMRHAPYFAPGTGWRYSNTNYTLAAMVIKKVTGRDWATEVTNRILRPLNMRHTFNAGQRTDLPDPHANGYLYSYDPSDPLDVTEMSMTWADADGSLITTAADLNRFWRAIGRGTLLPPAQTAEMRTTIGDDTHSSRYGLGIVWTPLTCGGGYWNHDGGVPGFSTVNGVVDGGHTTVVVSASSTPAAAEAATAANALIDHVLCDRSSRPLP